MARDESTRKLQLPDLFSMELLNEGPTPCIAAMVIMDQGKINQFGRIEYGGCIRHRDVELCLVGALALYLFGRFHIIGEVFPDMKARQNWYDTHLIDRKDPKREISYGAQAGGLKKAIQECGVVSKKVCGNNMYHYWVLPSFSTIWNYQVLRLFGNTMFYYYDRYLILFFCYCLLCFGLFCR